MSKGNSQSDSSPYHLFRELSRLWLYLSSRRKRQMWFVAVMMIASLFAEMISLAAVLPLLAVLTEPQRIWNYEIIQTLASVFIWQHPTELVVPICIAFAVAAAVAGGVRLLTLRSAIALASGAGSDLGIEVFKNILYLPYAAHLQSNSSNRISAIATEVDQVVAILKDLLQLFTAVLIGFGLVFLLLYLEPLVSLLVAIVLLGGYGFATFLSKRELNLLGPSIQKDQVSRIQILQEGLGAIRDVILDGQQPCYLSSYGNVDRRLNEARGYSQFLGVAPRYVMESVGLVAMATAALWLTNGQSGMSGVLPALGTLALGAQRLLPIMQLIYASWSGCLINLPALTSILSYLEQSIPEVELRPLSSTFTLQDQIQFDRISFRYANSDLWVLRDLSFTIRKGERIGIFGETGSGKSTMVDVLMGLLEPSAGNLLVDGESLNRETLRTWRSAIAHVPQSIFLSDSSIAENIAFGIDNDFIDFSLLKKCAEQAQIAGFIETLPDGYQTPTGERGVMLSGGQRQRIGIARALYKQSSVLVLDEATSALDEETESKVMDAIHLLSPNLTIIMIAHRISTMESCDRLIRIEGNSSSNLPFV